ncbi:MAG: DNA translocase FtsK [Marinilabiliaceae bacterium]|nr:DNA translocase FtsK [Marinilabiliaceae bacterium]
MAKNNKNSNNKTMQYTAPTKPIFACGLSAIIIGGLLLISFVSFFWSGGADRSIFDMSILELLKNNSIEVRNSFGKFGAWISDMMITNGIGVMAFCIPVVIVGLGLYLCGIKRFSLISLLWRCFLLSVWGSTTLGFIFYGFSDRIYLLLGGLHGYYIASWLMSWIGVIGTLALISLTLIIYLIFTVESLQNRISNILLRICQKEIRINWRRLILFGDSEGDNIEDEDDNNNADTEPSSNVVNTGESIDTNSSLYVGDGEDTSTDGIENDGESEDNVDNEDNDYNASEQQEPTIQIINPSNSWVASNAPQVSYDGPTIEFDKPIGDEEASHINNPNDDPSRPYDPTLDLSHYRYPDINLLIDRQSPDAEVSESEMKENSDNIIHTLSNFGIQVSSIRATVGPTVTLYELVPAPGVRITKIKQVQDDIALSLSALSIRMIAPMPGKGTVGIEVPNKNKKVVSMYSMIKSERFQNSKFELPIALGKTISNETFVFDLTKTPHLLVAGSTGQGKSVGLNAIMTSLLYKKHPSQVKFVIIDPKLVEFTPYKEIEKHFLAKLPGEEKAIITDVDKVKATLSSLVIEMENRYTLVMNASLRNIQEYNAKFIARKLLPTEGHRFLPYIVVIIDEFGDLIMTAGKEIETPIARIAQKARAVGIHMILATQRPSTNIITGVIKANFPSRIAFKVSSMVDSRTILDETGAQHLAGKGDMLAIIPGFDSTVRVQCAFVDTDEVVAINDCIASQQGYASAYELPEPVSENEDGLASSSDEIGKLDSLIREVAEMVVNNRQGSTSNIQRQYNLGYNRAGRIMDQLERMGIVGPAKGSKPRDILIDNPIDLDNILARFGA